MNGLLIRLILPVGLIVAACDAAAGDHIVATPSLTLDAGAVGNRYRAADAQQAEAFLEAIPAFAVAWFATEHTEYQAGASLAQRNFSTDAGEQQSSSLFASIHYQPRNLQIIATASGGTFRDTQIPEDDITWLEAALALGWNFASGQQLYLRTYYQPRNYDTRLTLDGKDQTADATGFTLGYFLSVSERLALWAEWQQFSVDSNEPLDTTDSLALAAGIDFTLAKNSTLAFSLRYANATEPDAEGIDTDTRLATSAMSYTQRFTHWCSWQSTARWEQFPEDGNPYNEWSLATGLTFATDLY